jgi:hypothetical protein
MCGACGGPDQACCFGNTCGNGYQCEDSKCKCSGPNRAVCGGAGTCVNLEDSQTNCGACGTACATGGGGTNEICVSGKCEACGRSTEQHCCSASFGSPFGPHVCFTDSNSNTLTCNTTTDMCQRQ